MYKYKENQTNQQNNSSHNANFHTKMPDLINI